jgi:predicted  nucleic acid-binding Zn-ribbon protein
VHVEIPALADLLDLQDVDLDIDRLLDQRQSLPELDQYKAANAARLEAEQHASELSDELKQMGLELDKSEGELEITEIKLSETETRLYSGGMNARETENKRLEVQQLRNRKGVMEESVIELLDSREALEARLEEARQRLEAIRSDEKQLEATIGQAWKEIDLKVGRFEARKAEITDSIPEDLLSTYERLRRTKEGVAVGRLEHGQCGGCHLALSTTEQNEAKESDPPLCVHCRRILVM